MSEITKKCLENPTILQNIFNQVSIASMENLQLREVNKFFNEEYLHFIRRTHQKICIEGLENPIGSNDPELRRIAINNFEIDHTNARKCFKFLTEIAKIKFHTLKAKSLERMSQLEYQQSVHSDILEVLCVNQTLKVFTGMESICYIGCGGCTFHSKTCQEHGPLQLNTLVDENFEPQHFRKLIVSQKLLAYLAESITDRAASIDHCNIFVKTIVNDKISCDLLVLEVSDYALFEHGIDENIWFIPPEPLPRELIEEMCRAWKPKSIKIRLCQVKTPLTDWTSKAYFTPFYFNHPSSKADTNKLGIFESLEIDVRSSHCARGQLISEKQVDETVLRYPIGKDENNENDRNHNFQYLIATFRKLFESKNIKIHNFSAAGDQKALDLKLLQTILGNIWRGRPCKKDTKFEFSIIPKILDLTNDEKHFQIPESFVFSKEHQVLCKVLPGIRYWTSSNCHFVVRQIVISDQYLHRELILDIYVNREELKQVGQETIQNGYLHLFFESDSR